MSGVVDAVNVGEPRPVELDGRTVWTAIWKSPVEGRGAAAAGAPGAAMIRLIRTVYGSPGQGRLRLRGRGHCVVGGAAGPGRSGRARSGSTDRADGLPVSQAVIGERLQLLLEQYAARGRAPAAAVLRSSASQWWDPRFLKRFAIAALRGRTSA